MTEALSRDRPSATKEGWRGGHNDGSDKGGRSYDVFSHLLEECEVYDNGPISNKIVVVAVVQQLAHLHGAPVALQLCG